MTSRARVACDTHKVLYSISGRKQEAKILMDTRPLGPLRPLGLADEVERKLDGSLELLQAEEFRDISLFTAILAALWRGSGDTPPSPVLPALLVEAKLASNDTSLPLL